ncbi:MAG: penicillin-binding protein 1C [Burkholderiales bacterium RIFCSPLOWO2_12_FULL_61_40]|nr:MAG: penicillin-binding protein 1C [Burkholderiales bacterium RIFCSPLOWO2_12_FULL_61_40]
MTLGGRWRKAAMVVAALAACLLVLDQVFPLPAMARPDATQTTSAQSTLVVLAQDGSPLRSWPSEDGVLRHPIALDAVSPLYLQALLHYEDRWFYQHLGVNPWAMARAAWQWARYGRIVSGGSTLTMQVARLVDPALNGAHSRGLGVKLRQTLRALQLELHLSKNDILTLYLNQAPMGGMVEGVEMASRTYLGKSARDLSHAEAALLTALPQSPSRLRPDRVERNGPLRAQGARDKVLERMQQLGIWDAATVTDAKLERVFAPPQRANWLAPLAAERLRQQRKPDGPALLQSTLDAGLQARLEQVLLDRLSSLPDRVSIAALVVENQSLQVRGYAGSADFTDQRRAAHVDMVRAFRSPGSTLKPFLYAMALDQGLVHSESLLIDAPQNFGGYAPGNFQSDFSGPVSLSEALQRSLNVPAVEMLDRIGPERFAAQLRQAGLRLRLPANASPNLSLILGGGSTSLEELVGAYTALARGGVAGRPRLKPDEPVVETRLMSAGSAFIVREILENGGRPGAPFRESEQRIAWKTGTSFGFRDAWAIGVTDRYTMGIWMGRPDGTPNPGHFGANSAAPLLRDLAAALGPSASRQQLGPRQVPASVKPVSICWPLGLAEASTASEHCLQKRMAWTLDGAIPPTLPDRLQTGSLVEVAWVDRQHRRRLRPDCMPKALAAVERVELARWPTLLAPWIGAGQRQPAETWPWLAACAPRSAVAGLRIVGLEPGSVLRPVPGQHSVVLKLTAVGARDGLTWLLNGQVAGQSDKEASPLHLKLQGGDQMLTAMDGRGKFAQVRFVVRTE